MKKDLWQCERESYSPGRIFSWEISSLLPRREYDEVTLALLPAPLIFSSLWKKWWKGEETDHSWFLTMSVSFCLALSVSLSLFLDSSLSFNLSPRHQHPWILLPSERTPLYPISHRKHAEFEVTLHTHLWDLMGVRQQCPCSLPGKGLLCRLSLRWRRKEVEKVRKSLIVATNQSEFPIQFQQQESWCGPHGPTQFILHS